MRGARGTTRSTIRVWRVLTAATVATLVLLSACSHHKAGAKSEALRQAVRIARASLDPVFTVHRIVNEEGPASAGGSVEELQSTSNSFDGLVSELAALRPHAGSAPADLGVALAEYSGVTKSLVPVGPFARRQQAGALVEIDTKWRRAIARIERESGESILKGIDLSQLDIHGVAPSTGATSSSQLPPFNKHSTTTTKRPPKGLGTTTSSVPPPPSGLTPP